MKANLHLHSRYSDGSLWPQELAQRAAATGLELAAVTDHDCLGGVREFCAAAAKAGMSAVPGCEIDCTDQATDYRSEILAYFPEGTYQATEAFLLGVAKARRERLFAWLEASRDYFGRGDLSFDDLVARKYGARAFSATQEGASLSKVDFYLYLQARGVVSKDLGYKDFRKKFLDSGLFPSPKAPRITLEEVVKVVSSDGGRLVIPHLGHEFEDSLDRIREAIPRLQGLLGRFKSLGIHGLELYYYRSPDRDAHNEELRRAAEAQGYYCTYGSDCHGPGSGKETLGLFSGDFKGFPPARYTPS